MLFNWFIRAFNIIGEVKDKAMLMNRAFLVLQFFKFHRKEKEWADITSGGWRKPPPLPGDTKEDKME